MIPLPKEDVTPPVTKMYLVFAIVQLKQGKSTSFLAQLKGETTAYRRHYWQLVDALRFDTVVIEDVFPIVHVGSTYTSLHGAVFPLTGILETCI